MRSVRRLKLALLLLGIFIRGCSCEEVSDILTAISDPTDQQRKTFQPPEERAQARKDAPDCDQLYQAVLKECAQTQTAACIEVEQQWFACVAAGSGESSRIVAAGTAAEVVLIAGGTTINPSAEIFDPLAVPAPRFTQSLARLKHLRNGHTATRITRGPDTGKVLIVGGAGNATSYLSGGALGTAELWDPVGDFFSCIGGRDPSTGECNETLGTARVGHTATMLTDGNILIAGGMDDFGKSVATAEIYDVEARTFSPTASAMTTERSFAVATLLTTGDVLFTGGRRRVGASDTLLSSAELYDHVDHTFSATAGAMTDKRATHSATRLANGKVLIAGGSNATLGSGIATAELYDPATKTFACVGGVGASPPKCNPSMTAPRGGHAAARLPDDSVLLAGGVDASGLDAPQATAEVFDPMTETFAALNASACPADPTEPRPAGCMVQPAADQTATVLDGGRVLLAGGGTSFFGYRATARAEIFDPDNGTFTDLLPSAGGGALAVVPLVMTTQRQAHTATLLADGRVFVAGGQPTFTGNRLGELFSPADGGVTHVTATASERQLGAATVLADGRVLFTGGHHGTPTQPITDSAEIYDPATARFFCTNGLAPSGNPTFPCQSGTRMRANRLLHSATLLASGKVLVAGGLSFGSFLTALDRAELFDPATGAFSCIGGETAGTCNAVMTERRSAHTATRIESGPNAGKVVLAGGVGAAGALATAETYDATGGAFSCVGGTSVSPPACNATLTEPRVGHTATFLVSGPDAGKILIAGGESRDGEPLRTAELLDPATGASTCVGGVSASPPLCNDSMVSKRILPTATRLPDGRVLLVGGSTSSPNGKTKKTVRTAEIYDPVTRTFTRAGRLKTKRALHAATLLSDGSVLVGGGFAGTATSSATGLTGIDEILALLDTGLRGRALDSVERWNPATKTFSVVGNLVVARGALTMVTIPASASRGEPATVSGAPGGAR